MSDPHGRFVAWLLDGASGDPPRDLAVHASLCASCMQLVAAHDALARIDVGRAPLPPWRPPAIRRALVRQAGRFAAATASMVLLGGAVILGASQILAGRAGNGQERAGGVLAASGSPEASASSGLPGSPSASGSATPSASPSASPGQTQGLRQPQATSNPFIPPGTPRASQTIGPPSRTPTSSPQTTGATATPSPAPTPVLTPSPTLAPTPVETPTETPSPSPS